MICNCYVMMVTGAYRKKGEVHVDNMSRMRITNE